ncbi:MAG: glutathione synthase [Wenzhouxiangella sp.]|jgi:glutathione synthase|nr:glutathione synthase [Wenzhouxiangella sp.]
MQKKRVIMVMDDIGSIHIAKDTSFALLLEAQRRGYELFYLGESELYLDRQGAGGLMRPIQVADNPADWFTLGDPFQHAFGSDDLVLMRADPPVDPDYLHATYLLELAESAGATVVNRPRALRDFNEKLAIAQFPDLIPSTLVSASHDQLRRFIAEHEKAVLKPLDGMGGKGIFMARHDDPNLNSIFEALTEGEKRPAMVQEFLPEISAGDKRVLVIGGRPVDYALARIPGSEDFRGNLARGGRGEGRPLSDSDRAIAEAVAPILVENGIYLAGLDVIGDRLTEINVTSPTCIRELDAQFGLNLAGQLFDAVDP